MRANRLPWSLRSLVVALALALAFLGPVAAAQTAGTRSFSVDASPWELIPASASLVFVPPSGDSFSLQITLFWLDQEKKASSAADLRNRALAALSLATHAR